MEDFEQKFATFVETLKKNSINVSTVMIAAIKAALIEAHLDGGSFKGNEIIRKKRVNGYNLYMKERMQQLKEIQPDVDSNHRMTQISDEWKKLSETEKESWKDKAKALPIEEIHIPIRIKKEPKEKKPHQISGYQLFVREKMSELKDSVPPKERMTQIGGLWKGLSENDKEGYKTRASAIPPQ